MSICPGMNDLPGKKKIEAVWNWGNGLKEYPFINYQKDVLISACLRDGLKLGDSSKQQIAVFVNKYRKCIDYHFIRLDLENDVMLDSGLKINTWSCQDSTGGPVTKCIKNPVEFNKSLVGQELGTGKLIDQMYAGLLYLPVGFAGSWD